MIQDVLSDAESRMSKAMDALRNHLLSIRTGRASPTLLDRVQVEYYGAPTPINQLASVNVPESRLIAIQRWPGDSPHDPALDRRTAQATRQARSCQCRGGQGRGAEHSPRRYSYAA